MAFPDAATSITITEKLTPSTMLLAEEVRKSLKSPADVALDDAMVLLGGPVIWALSVFAIIRVLFFSKD